MAQSITLPDGRIFEYLISGTVDGFPLFFIHGTPGSYLESAGLPDVCEKKGVKCITMCRAGYGESTRAPGRTVVDCVADIEALKGHLGVKECVVGGWSGGGECLSIIRIDGDVDICLTIPARPSCPSLRSSFVRMYWCSGSGRSCSI